MRRSISLTFIGALILAAAPSFAAPGELPRVPRLDTTNFTVSGLSSGAAMAVQIGTVHSRAVKGVGILAGPPFLCAEGSVTRAYNTCLLLGRSQARSWFGWLPRAAGCETDPGPSIDAGDLIADTLALARSGLVDPVDGIRQQRIWEFRGHCDPVVGANASRAQARFYGHFGATFVSRTLDAAVHTMPTDKPGLGACDREDPDYVSSCSFDAVGEMLRHVSAAPDAIRAPAKGRWLAFAQAGYIESAAPEAARLSQLSMAREAALFVPDLCAEQACRLHVALHGCLQGVDDAVYRTFVRESGYAEWASALGLVVLFPRVTSRRPFEAGFDPVGNPQGCWDWWGYTNRGVGGFRRYATREAPQIKAIMKMVGALGGR